VGGACSTHERGEKLCKVLVGKSEGMRPLGRQEIDGRIGLEWIILLGRLAAGRGRVNLVGSV
jgi:hypothetical protein